MHLAQVLILTEEILKSADSHEQEAEGHCQRSIKLKPSYICCLVFFFVFFSIDATGLGCWNYWLAAAAAKWHKESVKQPNVNKSLKRVWQEILQSPFESES